MSKLERIDALMESAIHSFSRVGYEGASLRAIARSADVPLSTIHLYFASKLELFNAVGRKAWKQIDRERSDLLERALANDPSRPALSDVIYALAYPVARRACSQDERDLAELFFLRRRLAQCTPPVSEAMLKIADRSLERWVDAFMLSCPTLSRGNAIWAFSFTSGVVYSWQLIDRRYDGLLGEEEPRTPEDVATDIAIFCCKGIQAIADRHVSLGVATENPRPRA